MDAEDAIEEARQDAERVFGEARQEWRDALRQHVTAPPDAGFSARLARLAEAARLRAAACEQAHRAGLEWTPSRSGSSPPYELQPGSGRRGPAELWEQFDEAVAELDRVSEGRSNRAVGRAHSDLAEIAQLLADAVESEDRASGLLPPARGKRRRSA